MPSDGRAVIFILISSFLTYIFFIVKNYQERRRPEKAPSRAAANSPVQGIFEHAGIRFTEGAKYGIPRDDRAKLLARPDSAPPQPDDFFKVSGDRAVEMPAAPSEEKKIGKEDAEKEKSAIIKFSIFESTKKFGEGSGQPNDCGMYANALAFGKESWDKETRLAEHLEGMTKPGEQGDHAQYDPGDKKTNDALSLEVGDMYRIDWDQPDKKPGEKCAHHVATVVARDGEDHVTSEAHADLKDPKPIFELYGTTKNTFWMAYHEYFSSIQMGEPFASKFQNPKNKK